MFTKALSSTSPITPCLAQEFSQDSRKGNRQIVVIDASIADSSDLVADVQSSSEVLLLDQERDSVTQIAKFLQGFPQVSSLHLVAHGSPGRLTLGNAQLSLATLDRYVEAIASWSDTLQGADLLIYGCEVAAGSMGQLFIQQLHQLTGANIAASTKPVGRTDTGINWQLDAHMGAIDTPVVFSERLLLQYAGQFEDPVVKLEVLPSVVSEEGSEEERTLIFQYTVDGDIPEGGLSILASSENGDLVNAQRYESGNLEGVEFGEIFEDINAFEVILTQPVAIVSTILTNDIIQEEDVTVTSFMEVLPFPEDLFDTPYVVDPASSSIITFTDGVEFADSPTVSITADTTELIAGQAVTFNFDVEGDLPAEGLTLALGSTTGTADLAFSGETPEGFAGPPEFTFLTPGGFGAENIFVTLTDSNASLTLTVAEDGLAEGTETVNLFVEDGEQYEIDPDNSSIDLSVSDADADVPSVKFEIIPSLVSEEGSVEERTILFQYTVDGVIPEGGLSVLVSNENGDLFNSQGFEGGNFDAFEIGESFEDINAFEVILTQPVSIASVVLTNDIIQEEDVTISSFMDVLPFPEDLFDTPYSVDPASSSVITFTDGVEFADSPTVSVTADTTELLEGQAVTFTFEVEGDLPADGLPIVVSTPMGTADLEFSGETPEGFAGPPEFTFHESSELGAENIFVTLTAPNASVTFNVAEDGIEEGTETINLHLEDGEQYEIDPDNSSIDLSVSDSDADALPVVKFEILPSVVSEEGSEEERTILFQYTVDGAIPEGGLSILASNENGDLFNSQGFEGGNFDAFEIGETFEDLNAFEVILTQPVSIASVVLTNDIIQEEDVTISSFMDVLPFPEDLFDTPYSVDPASSSTITFTDGVEFADSPTVSVTADTTDLIEGQAVTFTFDVEGDLPADGLTLALGSTTGTADLEFSGETPEGFAGPPEFTFPDSSGFGVENIFVTLTDSSASLTLTVAEDGLEEGTETVNLFVEDGEQYEVDPDNSSIDLSVSDSSELSETLVGTAADDTLEAGGGDDIVAGRAGNDVMTGGGGDDVLRGGDGSDIAFGGGGDDIVDGQAGDDVVSGAEGGDIVIGGAGNDTLMGVTGIDYLVGDSLSSGGGSDIFVYGNDDGTDTILDFEVGIDQIGLVEGELTFADLTLTQDGGNTLLTVTETSEVLAVLSNVEAEGIGEDSFVIVPDVSNIEEALALIGGESDTIGTSSVDVLVGTDGDDLIDGLLGNDIYTGGGGADQFVFSPGQGIDTITDFEVGVDQISLGGLTPEGVRFFELGSETFLLTNSNELLGVVQGVTGLDSSVFV